MNLILSVTNALPKATAKKLLKKSNANDIKSQCLAVLVDEDGNVLAQDEKVLVPYLDRVDSLKTAANFTGKLGETVADFTLASDAKKAPLQLLLVGVGKQDKLNTNNLQKVANTVYQSTHKRISSLTLAVGDMLEDNQVHQFALALLNASYRFDKYKSEQTKSTLTEIALLSNAIEQETIDYVTAVHKGQTLTRDVANEPGNVCFPVYMAEQAQALAKQYPDLLKVTILGEKKMEALGMNCFLAVSKGSDREGQLVLLEYQGKSSFSANKTASFADTLTNNLKSVADKLPTKSAKSKASKAKEVAKQVDGQTDTDSDAPIVLVGKGVTFDTGGISIKPAQGMEEMKFDMGGSAAVLGTIKALCEARLPINVVGALACAENMPSSNATRPGDIVTAMNGKSVEILNTDAEGRLVLCDTLSYVQRYNPRTIIDVATLTGACVIALGSVRAAVYSNNEDVLFELENASEQSGDLIWHMPLDDAYQSQLDSPCADMQNIGGRAAGSITAACFLSRFIEEGQAWAHLDIAGVANKSGKEKDATGRPVPLFMQYLKNIANA